MRKRAAHHPKHPGLYVLQPADYSGPLDGEWALAGYQARQLAVAAIPSKTARALVQRHHYSGRFVNNSYVHLGVFWRFELVGVMQFGYAMNPASLGKIVAGTGTRDYLELNRMWIDDKAPRNTESAAIALAIRFIRKALPHIRFIQTFADERCGGLGVMYQASGFEYLGSHQTSFYELDGETFHEMLLTAHNKAGQRGAYLRANIERATRHSFRQFRYIRFLKKGAKRHLRLAPKPFPKPINTYAAGQSGRPACPAM